MAGHTRPSISELANDSMGHVEFSRAYYKHLLRGLQLDRSTSREEIEQLPQA
jgi:hypothetical protein